MIIENGYSLDALYAMNEQDGATFTIEDGEITGVSYGNSEHES